MVSGQWPVVSFNFMAVRARVVTAQPRWPLLTRRVRSGAGRLGSGPRLRR
jgi:hypothetical protein